MSDPDPLARIETSLYLFGWAVLILALGICTIMMCFGVAILVR